MSKSKYSIARKQKPVKALLAVLILSCCHNSPAQTEINLISIKPGPYSMIADWQGQTGLEFTYTWNGITNKALTSASRQVINLPALTGSDTLPLIQITLTNSLAMPPQIQLHAQGDPFIIAQHESPTLPDPGRTSLIQPGEYTANLPLPDLRDAYLLAKRTENKDKTGELIKLQPLFRRRHCQPPQSGIYLFEILDEHGAAARNIARSMSRGLQTEVVVPENEFSGQCLQFIPLEIAYASNLEDDEIFRFSGFHKREDARGSHPPYQRWTAAGNSSISITCPPFTKIEVQIKLAAHRPENVPAGSTLIDDGTNRLPVIFEKGIWSGTIQIPPADKERITLSIISDTWSPAEALGSGDTRELGVMLTELSLRFYQ